MDFLSIRNTPLYRVCFSGRSNPYFIEHDVVFYALKKKYVLGE